MAPRYVTPEWQAQRDAWYRIDQIMILGAFLIVLVTFLGAAVVLVVGVGTDTCDDLPKYPGQVTNGSSGLPEPGLLVAFLADQERGGGAKAVLNLIRDEAADLVFHAGDLDYHRSPGRWSRMVRRELWTELAQPPYFIALGNHDVAPFSTGRGAGYGKAVMQMHSEAAHCCCQGKVGARAICTYRGLAVLQSSHGVTCDHNGGNFVRASFAELAGWPWKICMFHLLQTRMRIEGSGDQVGWSIYEECRRAGALIINGHSHVYARTHLLNSMQEGTVVHTNSTMKLEPGRSLAVVVGLGGHDIRAAQEERRADPRWAATLAAGDPDAAFGALFCRFVNTTRAECYFKTTQGTVVDQFVLTV